MAVGITGTFSISRKGDLSKRVKAIETSLRGPTTVKVGFPAGKAPGDLISIAYWNHEGTAGSGKGFAKAGPGGKMMGGFGGPIPPRPFITAAFFHHRSELRAFLKGEAKKIIFAGNSSPMRHALSRLGMKGQDMIQAQIGSNMSPANSPLTVALKGSSKTLIDSGRLFQSVTWEIDK